MALIAMCFQLGQEDVVKNLRTLFIRLERCIRSNKSQTTLEHLTIIDEKNHKSVFFTNTNKEDPEKAVTIRLVNDSIRRVWSQKNSVTDFKIRCFNGPMMRHRTTQSLNYR